MENLASQSRWIVIRTDPTGRITVTQTAKLDADIAVVTLDAGLCEANVTATVAEAIVGLDDEAIRLEVAKLAYQDHWRTLGFARQMLEAAGKAKAPVAGHVASAAEAIAVVHAVTAFLARTTSIRGWTRQVATNWLRACIPAFAALPGPIWLLARYGGSAPRSAAPALVWHAVHGESETRTRHLLPPAYDPHGSTVYLVLGRSRSRLDKVRRIIDPADALAHVELLRPMNLAASIRSLPRAAARIAKLLSALSCSPVRMSGRDVAALSFRLVQGEAHRAWWERLQAPPNSVMFAHTGTADTTAMERAIQHRGGQTHHVAHGVNTGWPFAAVSNHATFVCGHDAAFARRLPAYGETHHLPKIRPSLRAGDGRWLVLTSYTHPMGRPYACYGVQPDVDALDHVAAAARQCGVQADRIVWRPHPAIAKVAEADRNRVEQRAATHGFTRWAPDDALSSMAGYSVVITTPSTVLLDALGLGKLPILLATVPLQSDLLYAFYPLRAQTSEALATAVAASADEKTFQSVWDTIGPGNPIQSLQDLIDTTTISPSARS